MSVGTLMLDTDGDLILGDVDGAESVGVATGAHTVAQSAAQAVSTRVTTVWFNLPKGIDYDGLFYSASRSDAALAGVRATAFRDALLSVPGVVGLEANGEITFSRIGRKVTPVLPCIQISCGDMRLAAAVEALNA